MLFAAASLPGGALITPPDRAEELDREVMLRHLGLSTAQIHTKHQLWFEV